VVTGQSCSRVVSAGFVGRLVVATPEVPLDEAAGGDPASPVAPLREALRELVRACGLARKIGGNLNHAVARLNATQPGRVT
jgi:hypothetical protein